MNCEELHKKMRYSKRVVVDLEITGITWKSICKSPKNNCVELSYDGSLRDLSSSSTTGDNAEVVACTWKHFKT